MHSATRSTPETKFLGDLQTIAKPPAAIAALTEGVMYADRCWFEDDPQVEVRARVAVPGEFSSMDQSNKVYVVVGQVTHGFRLRFPFIWLNEQGRVQ